MNEISVCGVDCSGCKEYGKTCKGCNTIHGKVFWAPYLKLDTCPMYHCCKDDKQLFHCGHCSELPCRLYFDTRDPAMTEAEHQAGIRHRVEILKSMR